MVRIEPFPKVIRSRLIRWLWLPLILWLLIVYAIINFVLPGLIPPGISIFLFQPLLWTSVTLLAYLGWRSLVVRPRFSKALTAVALLTGAFQMAFLFITGLFFGFGYSPYDHRFLTLLGNFVYVGTMLVAVELSRAYFCALIGKSRPVLSLVVVTFVCSILLIPAGKYTLFNHPPGAFEAVGRTFLPILSENLLATFLALIGGPLAALGYRGALLTIEWLAPILPDLPLLVAAFMGTLVPVLLLLGLYHLFVPEEPREVKTKEAGGSQPITFVWIGIIAIILLWLNTGVFGIKPSLISGPSMSPELVPGDVIVTKVVPSESIVIGDIIRFQMGSIDVVHRVVDIQRDEYGIVFTTRGDYNNTNDPPFRESDFEGKVVLKVPYIGWVAILIRNALSGIL